MRSSHGLRTVLSDPPGPGSDRKENGGMESVSGMVTRIQRFAINDGPGIRTTVFLKGCPLRCSWCHNPECIAVQAEIFFQAARCRGCGNCAEICPEAAIDLKRPAMQRIDRTRCSLCMLCVQACPYGALEKIGSARTPEDVMKEVATDIAFYRNSGGGMTLSGGEPLLQSDFSRELLRMARSDGISTALDTCGHSPFQTVERLLEYVDLILYDIKHVDSEKHRLGSGKGNRLILDNCRRLSRSGTPMRIRVPIIPGFNDTDSDIRAIAESIVSMGLKDVDLLPYHDYAALKYRMLGRPYALASPLSELRIEEIKMVFSRNYLNVAVGG